MFNYSEYINFKLPFGKNPNRNSTSTIHVVVKRGEDYHFGWDPKVSNKKRIFKVKSKQLTYDRVDDLTIFLSKISEYESIQSIRSRAFHIKLS